MHSRPRKPPPGASIHVIRMRNSGTKGGGGTLGMRWEERGEGRKGGCGEDGKLKSGGYFSTQHRITAGGLPTGNTVSSIQLHGSPLSQSSQTHVDSHGNLR